MEEKNLVIERTELSPGRPPKTRNVTGLLDVDEVTDFLDGIQLDCERNGWSVLRGRDVLLATEERGYASVHRAVEFKL